MNERQQALKLYNDTFGVDERFDRALFDGFFEYCRTLCVDRQVVSMLFELPCELHLQGQSLPARYIYAVATRPDCRGRGYMGRLLNQCQDGGGVLILRPAESSLIDLYRRYGFAPFTAYERRDGIPFVSVDERLDRLADGGDIGGERFVMMCNGCDSALLEGLGFAYSMQ